MNEIDIKGLGYTYQSDGPEEDWALVYAREAIEAHCDSEVLDHPDGSVTREKIKSGAVSADKLSDDVIASIVAAQNTADIATELANTAQQTAEQAGGIASYAVDRANDIEAAANAAIKKLQEDYVNVETTATNALLAADSASNEASIGISEARAAQKTADAAIGLQEVLDSEIKPELENHQLQISQNLMAYSNLADRTAALEEDMGDVEAALDGIIAIQNSLMGVSE